MTDITTVERETLDKMSRDELHALAVNMLAELDRLRAEAASWERRAWIERMTR
jgi:ribosomal protein L29